MQDQQLDPLGRLKKLIVQQKTAALPDRPPDPTLQALHEDVVAYDRHVSEAVISVLGGSNQAGPYPDRENLQTELDARQSISEQQPMVELYQRYTHRLDEMLDLATQVARARS